MDAASHCSCTVCAWWKKQRRGDDQSLAGPDRSPVRWQMANLQLPQCVSEATQQQPKPNKTALLRRGAYSDNDSLHINTRMSSKYHSDGTSTPSDSIFDEFLDLLGCDSDAESSNTDIDTPLTSASYDSPPFLISSPTSEPTYSPVTPIDSPFSLSHPSAFDRRHSKFFSHSSTPAFSFPEATVPEPETVFYVRPVIAGIPAENNTHLALYMPRRSVSSFLEVLARKTHIHRGMIGVVKAVNPGGGLVDVDDDFLGQMPYGQAMVAQLHISEGATCTGGYPLVLSFDAATGDTRTRTNC